jgi:hypothetical protein
MHLTRRDVSEQSLNFSAFKGWQVGQTLEARWPYEMKICRNLFHLTSTALIRRERLCTIKQYNIIG